MVGMSDAVRMITEQVRLRVRRESVDLAADAALAESYVRDEVQRYSERALGSALPLIHDEEQAAREAVASLTGFGALQPYLDDPEIEEVWVNSPTRVFVARAGVPELTTTVLAEREVRELVERMLQSSGRRVDLSSPFVDASLPDGSRLHVVIPDVTARFWSLNIRKFSRRIRSLNQLVAAGSLNRQAAEFLRMCVLAGQNILVSGATQAGKTTMLNALIGAARERERIVTVEETFELDLRARDVVAMQCRQPSLEGTGEITLRRLIKEALRMRPDRLVVGEVREAESLDLLIALNSGVPGACSIHANSGRDALVKLCTLPLLAGRNIDSSFVLPTVASCVDIVVHCEMDRHGRRRLAEVLAVTGQVRDGQVEAEALFERRAGELWAPGVQPAKLEKFRAAGFDPAVVLGAVPA
ncbi:pilus assembly protein CpaF [Microterricola viridarii]|uniref:Pilus assembly protein CpaF n=2 Tax=Microterricola viridarii TaxID=412690 RepID=A0A1H1S1R6_9MICO|nr:pilus assembly protein CpaF [Microterricola viridarii]